MIRTKYDRLPVPVRGYDWCAYEKGHRAGGPMGWGSTEAEAIAHLRLLQDDRAAHPERWNDRRPWPVGWGDRPSPRSYGDTKR